MFSVFKQYYTYFIILFHPCISKNIENCYLNTYQTSPYFFYIPFKYSFIIIFYSFFIFPLSLLCLSLSQPNYSQHRRPSHPPTHTTTTTSTHHRCHQPLATNQINRNHNNSKGKKKKRKTSTSTYTVGLKKKNQWQSDQITTNHSKKKRRKTHKPWPNRTTNQINQIGPWLLRSKLRPVLHGWPPGSIARSEPNRTQEELSITKKKKEKKRKEKKPPLPPPDHNPRTHDPWPQSSDHSHRHPIIAGAQSLAKPTHWRTTLVKHRERREKKEVRQERER